MNTSNLTPTRGTYAAALRTINAAALLAPGSPSRSALSLSIRGDIASVLPTVPPIEDLDTDSDATVRHGLVAQDFARLAASVVSAYSPTPALLRVGSSREATGNAKSDRPVVWVRADDILDAARGLGPVACLDWIAGRVLSDLYAREFLSKTRLDSIARTITGRPEHAGTERQRLTDWLAHQLATCRGRAALVDRWNGWAGFVTAAIRHAAATVDLESMPPLPAAVAAVAAIAAGVDVPVPAGIAEAVASTVPMIDGKNCLNTAGRIVDHLASLLPASPEQQTMDEANEASRKSEDERNAAEQAMFRENERDGSTYESRKASHDAFTEARRQHRAAMQLENEARRNAAEQIQNMPDLANAGSTSGKSSRLSQGRSFDVEPSPATDSAGGARPVYTADGAAERQPRTVTVHTVTAPAYGVDAMIDDAAAAAAALSRLAWLISSPPARETRRTSGTFDASNLTSLIRGDGRCFARRPEEGEGRVAVTLLVDCSGSMRCSMDSVRAAAYALASSFASSRWVDVLVIGHDVLSAGGRVDLHDCGNDPRNIAGLRARGNNADGHAIEAAAAIARGRFPRHRHAMLLLADGAPSDAGYYGEAALVHTRETIDRLGFPFRAIAWDVPSQVATTQWRDRWTAIDSASNLVPPLTTAVGHLIEETRNA